MVIKSLSVENLRSHQVFSSKLSDTTTVMVGANGSGKTTLIEAIMVALAGRSFKGGDGDLLRYEKDWWKISLVLDDQERIVKYQPVNETKKKEFVIDGKSSTRLKKEQKYPIVLFEPDDLRLLQGSPSGRRKFIDNFAGQLVPDYSRATSRYERALLQRNKLLKMGASDSDLFAWNISLAKYGAYVTETRARLINKLDSEISDIYYRISKTRDKISIKYSHPPIGNTEQQLLDELESGTSRDRMLGFTDVGPHRHDILFEFNGAPAASTASRGETRTLILALKFLEVDIIESVDGRRPIVLLDDVFSELDSRRQTQLADNFKNHQIIMTGTAAPKTLKAAKIINIKQNTSKRN